jgi:hypothetical protein
MYGHPAQMKAECVRRERERHRTRQPAGGARHVHRKVVRDVVGRLPGNGQGAGIVSTRKGPGMVSTRKGPGMVRFDLPRRSQRRAAPPGAAHSSAACSQRGRPSTSGAVRATTARRAAVRQRVRGSNARRGGQSTGRRWRWRGGQWAGRGSLRRRRSRRRRRGGSQWPHRAAPSAAPARQ